LTKTEILIIHTLCLWKSFNTSGLSIHYAYEKASTHPGHRFSRPLENLWKIRCTKGIEERNTDLATARPIFHFCLYCLLVK